jgi:Rrf2 family protein
MRLTRAGEYAVRCVLYLSARPGEQVTGRREIAEAMDIPYQFLGKIAQDLARAGILQIRQGAQGGYRLARPPRDISLLMVVEAVDGEIFLNDCLVGPDSCRRQPICPVHSAWDRARNKLRESLAGVDFAELAGAESCLESATQKSGAAAAVPAGQEDTTGPDEAEPQRNVMP